jgi:hypothetical protein
MSLVVALTEPLGLPVGFPLVPFLNGITYTLPQTNHKHQRYLKYLKELS